MSKQKNNGILSVIGNAVAPRSKAQLNGVDGHRGWWPIIKESFSGAWQQNVEISKSTVLSHWAVFSCVSLIASDISKIRIKLVRETNGLWSEVTNKPEFSSVLKKPNSYQNMIQFLESWAISKLSQGNTYVLKERNREGRVVRMYILDPLRTTPLVSDSGDVYYQLATDNLNGLTNEVTVPASEIIHDRFNCLFHPLVGLSPIFACGIGAIGGLNILHNSSEFFKNMSRPSGILSAPGAIGDETARRLKEHWESNYSGENIGKVAVLGDSLKYEALSVTANDAQLVEQLKMSAEMVCGVFHVPLHKVIGDAPSYNNVQAMNQEYYTQCLQVLFESIELCLDEGLGLLENNLACEFDLDQLLKMDTAAQIKTLSEAVGGGVMTPNEARFKVNSKPIIGGDTVYLQQQQFSLEALAKRDAKEDPFAKSGESSSSASQPAVEPEDNEERALSLSLEIKKAFMEESLEL